MKERILLLTNLVLSLFIFNSCIFTGPSLKGNGNVVEENRTVSDFEEIKVSRGMNVYLSQGDFTKVVVRADENLLDAIETRREGDALVITASRNIRKARDLKVFVTVPHISLVKTSSGSNVYSETVIRSKDLELSGSAGSNIKLEIEAGSLEVSLTAGSNADLQGEAEEFFGKASAGSNLKARGLSAGKCKVKTNSGANIWITVTSDLEAHASSGGNIFYNGEPEFTDIEKNSGGNVIKD